MGCRGREMTGTRSVKYSNTIDICLATYNGAVWIGEFLDSLDAQTHADWRLIVADDASTDGTLDLIRAHFSAMPDKLTVVQRAQTGQGVVQNFADAIDAARSAYVMPADQDDIWVPQKLATMLSAMRRAEQDGSVPTLVFSDLEVVDADLATLDPSWWSHTGIKAHWASSFKTMLSQNIVPGCAMMLNRRLLELAMPMPAGVIMHDWWFLLVALAFGRVDVCSETLVRYRRHPGAHTYWSRGGILSAVRRQYAGIAVTRRNYANTVTQARAFDLAFGKKLDESAQGRRKRAILRDYIRASTLGWWRKRWLCMRIRVHLVSLLQTTKFYISI
jgi:glycosyltransferase involved in cell wall biosynthesis